MDSVKYPPQRWVFCGSSQGGGCLCAFSSTSIYSLSSLRTWSLSASPEPVSPHHQSSVSSQVPLVSHPPRWLATSQAKPLESWWVILSQSSPANLAADSFVALFPWRDWFHICSCLSGLAFSVSQVGQALEWFSRKVETCATKTTGSPDIALWNNYFLYKFIFFRIFWGLFHSDSDRLT